MGGYRWEVIMVSIVLLLYGSYSLYMIMYSIAVAVITFLWFLVLLTLSLQFIRTHAPLHDLHRLAAQLSTHLPLASNVHFQYE